MKTFPKSIKRIVLTVMLAAASSAAGFEAIAMACYGYQRGYRYSNSYGSVGVPVPRSYGSGSYYSSRDPRYRSWTGQNYRHGGTITAATFAHTGFTLSAIRISNLLRSGLTEVVKNLSRPRFDCKSPLLLSFLNQSH